jgi:hypothetical protein
MSRASQCIVSVASIGLRQYKRGSAPLPEQGILIRAIIDVCKAATLRKALFTT